MLWWKWRWEGSLSRPKPTYVRECRPDVGRVIHQCRSYITYVIWPDQFMGNKSDNVWYAQFVRISCILHLTSIYKGAINKGRWSTTPCLSLDFFTLGESAPIYLGSSTRVMSFPVRRSKNETKRGRLPMSKARYVKLLPRPQKGEERTNWVWVGRNG